MAQGILTFSSLREALQAGFQVVEPNADGYLVRQRGPSGWELAQVLITPEKSSRYELPQSPGQPYPAG